RAGGDEEFGAGSPGEALTAGGGSPAAGHVDLLTVVTHELGHVLGLDHDEAVDDVMAESLVPGVRRVPTAAPQAAATWTKFFVVDAGADAGVRYGPHGSGNGGFTLARPARPT